MKFDEQIDLFLQPALFETSQISSGTLELIPKLWYAAEALSSPDDQKRKAALSVIIDQNAARYSPLISYLLFTRIEDPNPEIQKVVVEILSDALNPDEKGLLAPDSVRSNLFSHLSTIDSSSVLSLLELVSRYPEEEEKVGSIIKVCSNSGQYLADILLDRSQPIIIRDIAANFIGKIGYLEAIPALERLVSRLETKFNGQQYMPFSTNDPNTEITLIPTLRLALKYLYAP